MAEEYKYFSKAGVMPIRVHLCDHPGLEGEFMSAETPHPATGELAFNISFLSKIAEDKDADIQEISKEEFDTLHEGILADKRENPPQFRYFFNGNEPIRATVSANPAHNGVVLGTEAPSIQTGELVLNMNFVAAVSGSDTGEAFEEITEEQFYALCEQCTAQKKSDPSPAP